MRECSPQEYPDHPGSVLVGRCDVHLRHHDPFRAAYQHRRCCLTRSKAAIFVTYKELPNDSAAQSPISIPPFANPSRSRSSTSGTGSGACVKTHGSTTCIFRSAKSQPRIGQNKITLDDADHPHQSRLVLVSKGPMRLPKCSCRSKTSLTTLVWLPVGLHRSRDLRSQWSTKSRQLCAGIQPIHRNSQGVSRIFVAAPSACGTMCIIPQELLLLPTTLLLVPLTPPIPFCPSSSSTLFQHSSAPSLSPSFS